MIGLKFFNGTFGLFGLGNGVRCPNLFFMIFPSLCWMLDDVRYVLMYTFRCIFGYFSLEFITTGTFVVFQRLITFLTSWNVIGFLTLCGLNHGDSLTHSCFNKFSKYSSITWIMFTTVNTAVWFLYQVRFVTGFTDFTNSCKHASGRFYIWRYFRSYFLALCPSQTQFLFQVAWVLNVVLFVNLFDLFVIQTVSLDPDMIFEGEYYAVLERYVIILERGLEENHQGAHHWRLGVLCQICRISTLGTKAITGRFSLLGIVLWFSATSVHMQRWQMFFWCCYFQNQLCHLLIWS